MTTKTYKIETGVKMPPASLAKSNGLPSRAAVTFAALEKGESFLVRDLLEAMRVAKTMRDMNGRHRDVKAFASRKVRGGVRFWRVK